MSKPNPIPFQNVDFDKRLESVTAATTRLAETDNIPALTFPKTSKGEGAPTRTVPTPQPKPTGVAPTKRFPIELPDYVKAFINRQALDQNVTNRYFILDALRRAGVPIKDIDMVEDGRRIR